jgi:hypothetical protein
MAGPLCPNMSDVIINMNVTAAGQVISAFCVPAVDTILNGSAVQGRRTPFSSTHAVR